MEALSHAQNGKKINLFFGNPFSSKKNGLFTHLQFTIATCGFLSNKNEASQDM